MTGSANADSPVDLVGAFRGSNTYFKFHVRGELPARPHARFLKRIEQHAFRSLEPEEEDDERFGWCVIDQLLNTQLNHDDVFRGDYVTLGLRIDRWRIPKPLLEAHLAEAKRAALANRDGEKLGRKEASQLEAKVKARLKKRTMPSMKAVDVVWHMDGGSLLFWSHSKGMHEKLTALFEKTFGLELVPNSPYVAAAYLDFPDKQLEALAKLEPASFTEEA